MNSASERFRCTWLAPYLNADIYDRTQDLDDYDVIMNDQLNILISKTIRKLLYNHPTTSTEALEVMQYIDNKLLLPIDYNKMKKLSEEVTIKLQSFV